MVMLTTREAGEEICKTLESFDTKRWNNFHFWPFGPFPCWARIEMVGKERKDRVMKGDGCSESSAEFSRAFRVMPGSIERSVILR